MSNIHYLRDKDGKFAGSTAGATPPGVAPVVPLRPDIAVPTPQGAKPQFPGLSTADRLEVAAAHLPEDINLVFVSEGEQLTSEDIDLLLRDPHLLEDNLNDYYDREREALARDIALEALAATANGQQVHDDEVEELTGEVRHRDDSDPLMTLAARTRVRLDWTGSTNTVTTSALICAADLVRHHREGTPVRAAITTSDRPEETVVELTPAQLEVAKPTVLP